MTNPAEHPAWEPTPGCEHRWTSPPNLDVRYCLRCGAASDNPASNQSEPLPDGTEERLAEQFDAERGYHLPLSEQSETAHRLAAGAPTIRRFQVPMGELSRRIHGSASELMDRARAARGASHRADDRDEPMLAASLRGKATAYAEAAEVVRALERGHRLPKRWWRSA